MNALSVIRSRNVYLDKSGDTRTAHRHSIYMKSNTYVVWLPTSLELLKKLNMYLVFPKNMNMHIISLLFVNYLNEHVNVKRVHKIFH